MKILILKGGCMPSDRVPQHKRRLTTNQQDAPESESNKPEPDKIGEKRKFRQKPVAPNSDNKLQEHIKKEATEQD
jgi:hypothetical protein